MTDEIYESAIFNDLSSSPSTMEGAKAVDVHACLPGHIGELADAPQAYTQTFLLGTETWVSMDKDPWPKSWHGKFDNPVVPLLRALYGHPESGGWWERHAEKGIFAAGFKAVPEWKSTYFHKKLKLLLTVYVDDFKMAGPKANVKEGWKLLQGIGKIELDTPTPFGKYLGCNHEVKNVKLGDILKELGTIPACIQRHIDSGRKVDMNKIVTSMVWDNRQFMEQCLSTYQALAAKTGQKVSFKKVDTPFLDEAALLKHENDHFAPSNQNGTKSISTASSVKSASTGSNASWSSTVSSRTQSSSRAASAASSTTNTTTSKKKKGKAKKKANVQSPPGEGGIVQPIAASCLIKVLYGARMARPDLLRATCYLARLITKWTPACDKMLHRLMCYISSTLDVKMQGFIGDEFELLSIELYSDADLASCKATAKSTSGFLIATGGPHSFFAINWISNKQTCQSHSTAESEIIAADVALRVEGIPALQLW